MPNILFVHAGAELYGADRVLLELLAGLKERGYGLHVVLPGPGPLNAEIERLGVPVYRHNLGVLRRKYMSPLGLLNRGCRVFRAMRFLSRQIRDRRIDVVHSNTTAVFAGVLAARLCGVRHVWHVHEITTRPLWFARCVAWAVALLTDRAVFVSRASLDHMCTLSPSLRPKAMVIHNGIDVQRVEGRRQGVIRGELGWSEANPIVGMIGRINWWKGQGKLAECAAGLRRTHPQLRYLMVGGTFDGDDRPRELLMEQIREKDLQAIVAVLDFRSDVGSVLADIDVFVLPSTEPDPFPTVVLEAMAAGKVVVGFRHGGVCEMVEEGRTGLLCKPCSTQEMQAAIRHLADNPSEAMTMGQAGLERLQRMFTRGAYVESFSRLYETLATY